MDVIVIETDAFYKLIEDVVDRLNPKEKDRWILEVEAMSMLGIKSKTTLWELRNNGKIRYSQPRKRIILYDRESILNFLDKNAKNTF